MPVPGAESLGRTVLELSVDDSTYNQKLDAAEKKALDLGGTFAKVARDLSSFTQAVTKTGQQSQASSELMAKAFNTAKVSTTGLVESMRQFTGLDVVTKAHEYAAALQEIGGATKLTATEQANVNRVVTEAIDKYRALGQEVPKHLSDLAKATQQSSGVTSFFEGTVSKLAAAFSISSLIDRGVGALVSWTKEAIASAGATLDMADKTGLSTDTIQKFAYVALQTSTSVDAFTKASFNLGTTLAGGGKSVESAVAKLGLSFQELQTLNPDAQFDRIVEALERMENPQERNRIAVQLFGKAAKDILPAIAQGYHDIAEGANIASRSQLEAIDRMEERWQKFVKNRQGDIGKVAGGLLIAGEQTQQLGFFKSLQAFFTGGPDTIRQLNVLSKMVEEFGKFQQKAAADTGKNVDVLGEYKKTLDALKGSIVPLTAEQQKLATQAIDLNQSTSDIAHGMNVSEISVEKFKEALMRARQEGVQANNWIKEFRNGAKELETQLKLAAAAGVPMTIVLDEFGSAIQKVVDRAPILGDAIGDATKKAADALNKAQLAKVLDKAFTQVSDDARKLVDKMEDAGRQAGERFTKELQAGNKGFLQEAGQIEKGYIQLGEDSLQKRLALINLEYDAQVSALDKESALFPPHFALIEAQRKAALDKATQDWEDHVSKVKAILDSLTKTLADLPGLIAQAFSSGNFAQAFKSIGTRLAADILAPLMKGLTKLQQAGISTGSSFAAALGGAAGGGTVSTVAGIASGLGGAALAATHWGVAMAHAGVAGTVALSAATLGIGAAAVGAALLIKHFTDSKGRDAVKNWVKENFGTFDALQRKLEALGDEGKQLWINLTQGVGRNNPRQAQAAIDAIATALEKAATKDAAFNTNLTTTLSKVLELGGGLDESLTGYLGQLKESGRLTQDNIDLLAQLAGGGTITFQQLQEAAQRYGIDEDKLGQAFNAQKLHEGWQQVIDDLDLFGRANVDVNGLLSDMSDEISGLVNDSIKFKTDIPENMRTWIQKLIDAGKLLDDSGHKITDISKLKFGDTLQTTLETLNKTLKDLIATLKGVPPAIDAIPDDVDVNVNYREHHYRDDSGDGSGAAAATGGIVGRGRILPFAAGGMVPHLDAFTQKLLKFAPKGTDTVPAMLTPGEWVLNAPQQRAITSVIAAAARGTTVPKSLAGAYPLPATGTDGRAGTPITVNYAAHHDLHINALDGASVQRVVRSREFNEALKDASKQDLHGLRTHLQNVIRTCK